MTSPDDNQPGLEQLASRAEYLLTSSPGGSSGDKSVLPGLVRELMVHPDDAAIRNGGIPKTNNGLDASHGGYHDLFESAPVGYLVLDSRGGIRKINKAGSSILGIDGCARIGWTFFGFIQLDSWPVLRAHLTDVFEKREAATCELNLAGSIPGACLPDACIRMDSSPCLDAAGLVRSCRTAIMSLNRPRETEQMPASVPDRNEQLLRDIQHRLKNHLQVVISLLKLQARKDKGHNVANALRDAASRVVAVCRVHESISAVNETASLDFRDYLQGLTTFLVNTYAPASRRVSLELDMPEVFPVDLDSAVPCGLVINELVTNALKHAFPGSRPGRLRIAGHRADDGKTMLVVEDNGIGIPEGLDWRHSDSVGFSIIPSLVEEQLRGTIELDRTNGTCFTIRFKPDLHARSRKNANNPA